MRIPHSFACKIYCIFDELYFRSTRFCFIRNPFVSRVFEKLIYNQLYDYLDRNKLLFSKQSGFRSLHSVVTCLLKCTNDWYLDMDKGQYTAMIFVDLKKAFDTVNHEILL